MNLKRNPVTTRVPYALVCEREAIGNHAQANVTTVFLTASECPIGCSMCDLWVNTLDSPTPIGAIPKQIDHAIEKTDLSIHDRIAGVPPLEQWIKLYNSGNFFDPASIPPSDYPQIAERVQSFSRVIVENHPRFGNDRVRKFQNMLQGKLEIAVGLETVQPRWLARIDKKMTRADFDRYAIWLSSNEIDMRVFLIVGVPGVSMPEALRWTRVSVRHAFHMGARHISLIPARRGNGWGSHAQNLPYISIRDYEELQQLALDDVQRGCVVTIDTWDLSASEPNERQSLDRIQAVNQCQ